MKWFQMILIGGVLFAGPVVRAESTFADLAVFLAKQMFTEHVPADATVEDCVSFLNDQGICFSQDEYLDPSIVVVKEDFARVVGQSILLFLGEAELENGCVKRPKEMKTWVDYCLMNDIVLVEFWGVFVQSTKERSLPEVNRFFGWE